MRECPKCSSCQDDSEERCPRDGDALVKTLAGAALVDGKYRLEKRLSQGGMGVVYLARHVGLQREFAVKLIRSTGGWDAAQLARFRLEAETLGRLKHPGIVDVTDFGIDARGGGLPYLVMEHLEGTTLMERCRAKGPLPIDEALPILAAVGRAIDFAHQHGVVHRDLKPANVFLCDDGAGQRVKLLDFGLARRGGQPSPPSGHRSPISANAETLVQGYPSGADLSNAPTLDAGYETASAPNPLPVTTMTPPGSLAGTLLFMAPECFLGGETTPATDTYALGVTAYFTLVGKHPFEGSASAVMDGHLHRDPPLPSSIRPDLAPSLDAVLLAPLAKQTAKRPPSAGAFVGQLAAAVRKERVRRWWRQEGPRRSALAAAIAFVLMALAPVAMGLGALDDLHRRSVDLRMRALPGRSPDPRLRIVVLDQASLERITKPLGSREMADEMAARLEDIFAAGARGVALDILLPPAWSGSEPFSKLVLRHQDALTLAAHVSPAGEVVGPEALQGLIAVALGPEALPGLFGLVNVDTDPDGVVRRAHLGYPSRAAHDQQTWAVGAARHLLGQGSPRGDHRQGEGFWIDCSSEWKEAERVAFKDVALRLEHQPSYFSGALVLVGADLAGSGDERHRLAAGRDVPGVVLQAMTVDTILNAFPIRDSRQTGILGGLALFGVLSGLGLLVLTARRPVAAVLLGGALALLYAIGVVVVFPTTRVLVPLVSEVLQAGAALLVCLLVHRSLSPLPTT